MRRLLPGSDSDECAFEMGRGFSVVFEDGLQGEARLAFVGEIAAEACEIGFVGSVTNGAEVSADGALVVHMALANDDVGLRTAQKPPQQAITAEGGQGVLAAAKRGAQMIAVPLERRGQDEMRVVTFRDMDTHGCGNGNLFVKKSFEILGGIHFLPSAMAA
jgi:hypothetical protein